MYHREALEDWELERPLPGSAGSDSGNKRRKNKMETVVRKVQVRKDLARLVAASWFGTTATVRTGFLWDGTWTGSIQVELVSWSQCWWRGVLVILLRRCWKAVLDHSSLNSCRAVCVSYTHRSKSTSEFHTPIRKRYKVFVSCHEWCVYQLKKNQGLLAIIMVSV